MARGVNMAILLGNVGAEPEIRTTQGGTRMAKFSLATSRTFTDRNQQTQEETEWHRCTVWGKLADVVEAYVHKGDRLYIRGRIHYSTSEDNRGNKTYWTDIIVDDLTMLGSPQGGGGGGGGYQQQQRRPLGSPRPPAQQQPQGGYQAPPPSPFDQDDDDLPF